MYPVYHHLRDTKASHLLCSVWTPDIWTEADEVPEGRMNSWQQDAAKLLWLSRPSKKEAVAGKHLCPCTFPTPAHPNEQSSGQTQLSLWPVCLGFFSSSSSPTHKGSSLGTLLLLNTFPGSTILTHYDTWGMSQLRRCSQKCKWNTSPNTACHLVCLINWA